MLLPGNLKEWITLNDTIEYILEQTYVQNKLKPICSKLIFKRLLIKLSTVATFTFAKFASKQIVAPWVVLFQ